MSNHYSHNTDVCYRLDKWRRRLVDTSQQPSVPDAHRDTARKQAFLLKRAIKEIIGLREAHIEDAQERANPPPPEAL